MGGGRGISAVRNEPWLNMGKVGASGCFYPTLHCDGSQWYRLMHYFLSLRLPFISAFTESEIPSRCLLQMVRTLCEVMSHYVRPEVMHLHQVGPVSGEQRGVIVSAPLASRVKDVLL